MKTLALLAVIVILAGAGYYGYTNYQQQQLLEQSVARMEQEKQALQDAQASKDILALNQFIADHPQSNWLEKAIYERDKLAYHQATETNRISALEKFISQYKGSQWITQARNRLQRLQQEQKLRADIERKQQQLEIQRQEMAKQQSTTGELEEKTTDNPIASTTPTSTPAPAKTSSSLSSRDRVSRALAIYQKQRQQEQHTDTEQQQEDLKEERIKKRCLQIKDQIAQFNNRRIKWYDLDGSGKRVYLNKKQVSINRKRLREEYNQNCE